MDVMMVRLAQLSSSFSTFDLGEQEESFGPIIGIMSVSSDSEALTLMNDSPYGLTASVWTDANNEESRTAFEVFVEELQAGTVFLNRCVSRTSFHT